MTAPASAGFSVSPHTIDRGDPLWVAPLGGEVRTVLSRKNPFFEHAEGQLFVACRAGRDVGRIAAIIDHRHNELRGIIRVLRWTRTAAS
ncbi:MAG: hypothetical protein DMD76_17925 [Candidatus Rokuibacteriota bacterium]|nr:MAG: hypothetical protein DMD76_17925 [Candidatus Rokubacteria bacterium]